MSAIFYNVTASFREAGVCERYIAWLSGGHVQAVIAGGAMSAEIARVDVASTDQHGARVQVRYVFVSRADLDRYVREVAPGLRAEGVALWGGVAVFERTVGEVVGTFGQSE